MVNGYPEGGEVIYQPMGGSDMACVMVAVDAGSVHETSFNRGISHLVEHLVFDGSERYSREEISGWVGNRGGFLNAFTRKETTVFFLMVRSCYLEGGLEILSQMLLHSIFPPSELEKERRVVIEEIREGLDDPVSHRNRLVERYLYRGSLLAEPVLGYQSNIEAVTRAEIIDYYREHYRPSGMRIFLMGDFDISRAEGWIADYFFGESPPGGPEKVYWEEIEAAEESVGREGGSDDNYGMGRLVPGWSNQLIEKHLPGLKPGLDILVRMPGVESELFPALILLHQMLEGENSPLQEAFSSRSLSEPEVGLEVHREFSALRLSCYGKPEGPVSEEQIGELLKRIAGWRPSPEQVDAARVSLKSGLEANRERYHLYIMREGERIAMFGERYLRQLEEGIPRAGSGRVRELLKRNFAHPEFNGCITGKLLEMDEFTDKPVKMEKKVLKNGCVIASRHRSGSGMAAVFILFKGRNCLDGGEDTISPFLLNAVLEHSGEGKALSSRLARWGARVMWSDNPYIPFDNYYLNPAFSFVALQSPAENVVEACRELLEYLTSFRPAGEDIDGTMKNTRGELAVRLASPSSIIDRMLRYQLFGDHPYGEPVIPSSRQLESIYPQQVADTRDSLIAGNNIIVSVVWGGESENTGREVAELFENIRPGRDISCPPPGLPETGQPVARKVDKKGAYIVRGWLIEEGEGFSYLPVTAGILSMRMQQEIRENLGLAYSTGCSVERMPGCAVIKAVVGTRAKNRDSAMKALDRVIESLIENPAGEQEIVTAISRLRGRRARRKLSTMNRAYLTARDIYFDNGQDYDFSGISGKEILRSARYLDLKDSVLIELEPSGKGEMRGGMGGMHPGG